MLDLTKTRSPVKKKERAIGAGQSTPQETQLDERVSMTYALSPSHIPYRLSIHFFKTKATATPNITPHVSITTSVI